MQISLGLDAAALGQFVAQLRAFAPTLTFSDTGQQSELTATVEELALERNSTRIATRTERVQGLVSRSSGPLKDVAAFQCLERAAFEEVLPDRFASVAA